MHIDLDSEEEANEENIDEIVKVRGQLNSSTTSKKHRKMGEKRMKELMRPYTEEKVELRKID